MTHWPELNTEVMDAPKNLNARVLPPRIRQQLIMQRDIEAFHPTRLHEKAPVREENEHGRNATAVAMGVDHLHVALWNWLSVIVVKLQNWTTTGTTTTIDTSPFLRTLSVVELNYAYFKILVYTFLTKLPVILKRL